MRKFRFIPMLPTRITWRIKDLIKLLVKAGLQPKSNWKGDESIASQYGKGYQSLFQRKSVSTYHLKEHIS